MEENTCTDACSEEYYNPPNTSKIESKGDVHIEGVNAKHRRDNSELIEIVVERISVKTQKISIRTLEKSSNNKESKFPCRFKLSKIENFLVDCNLFPKDYDEYNVAKKLI